jgi:hypothetical protein
MDRCTRKCCLQVGRLAFQQTAGAQQKELSKTQSTCMFIHSASSQDDPSDELPVWSVAPVFFVNIVTPTFSFTGT